ncbi:putative MFS family arabinose efflux permease [Kitasatospora sp. SolWspMP-SS2h]|uniref:MFS transporter n=1 Tax=Kitasatospora sp. SolWspMP-SS2h TaxID=1305729 RepID=UPI000DB956CD|nr:MFS transporter [Kitasatospora sp. SolWspMP-SS2h]RAJ40128.1 putative MFS family arabinose efflux permease [Kitasatospora sp. SolWspMP-SS2h]
MTLDDDLTARPPSDSPSELSDPPSDPPSGAGSGTLPSPWRSHRFRMLFVARSSSLLADGMLMVSLTAAVLRTGYGESGVGYALAAWMAPIVLLVLFGGVLADRFTPQLMMVGADAVRMLAMLALALLLATTDVSLWQIMALMALSGAATAMFQPGLAGLVPRVAEDVQRANALLRISEAVCTLLGPGLAGLVVGYWNVAGSFTVIAAAFALSALGLLPLRNLGADKGAEEPAAPIWQRLAVGWREFSSRPWLWGVIAVWSVYGLLVFGPSVPLGAVALTDQHGSSGYGWIASADGAGTIVGGLLGMRVRPARPLVAGACAMLFFSLNPLAPALHWSFALTAATGLVAGCGFAFWGVMWSTSVQTHVPLNVLSRVSAYDVAGSIMVIPVGRALSGPVAAAFGIDRVLLFAALVGLLLLGLMIALPAVRGLGRTPVATAD